MEVITHSPGHHLGCGVCCLHAELRKTTTFLSVSDPPSGSVCAPIKIPKTSRMNYPLHTILISKCAHHKSDSSARVSSGSRLQTLTNSGAISKQHPLQFPTVTTSSLAIKRDESILQGLDKEIKSQGGSGSQA